MKKLLVLSMLLLPSVAFAQQQQQEKEYTITLTSKEIGFVYEELTKLSFKDVFVILNKIQTQVNAQNNPTVTPDKPKKE